jgi:hypothetical protein
MRTVVNDDDDDVVDDDDDDVMSMIVVCFSVSYSQIDFYFRSYGCVTEPNSCSVL